MSIENQNYDKKEGLKNPELSSESKVETQEDLEKQLAEIKAKLENFKNESKNETDKSISKIDNIVSELGGEESETSAVKEEINEIEEQKQEVIKQGEEEIKTLENDGIEENAEVKKPIEEVKEEEIKKIKDQRDQMLQKNYEAQDKIKEISKEFDKIIKEKGYDLNISELNNQIYRSQSFFSKGLFPDIKSGLSNLDRISLLVDGMKDDVYKIYTKKILDIVRDKVRTTNKDSDYSLSWVQSELTPLIGYIPDDILRQVSPSALNSQLSILSSYEKIHKIKKEKEEDPEIVNLNQKMKEQEEIIDKNSSYKIDELDKKLKEIESPKEVSNIENQ